MSDDKKIKKQASPVKMPETASSTVLGESVIVKGRLKSGEDLIIKGRIEAEITSEKALYVETSGIVKANVRVKHARISGIVVGDIFADDKIEIAADGRVVGDLTSPRIIISDGAAFKGRIEMPNAEEVAKKRREISTTADAPTGPSLVPGEGLAIKGPADIPSPPKSGDRKGPHPSPNAPATDTKKANKPGGRR